MRPLRLLLIGTWLALLGGCAPTPTTGDDAAAPAPTAATPASGYLIGPEDVLDISVWREEGLQREVLVRPDGGISFPLAGEVAVAGRTPEAVQQEIAERLRRYIPQAVVTVSVKQIAGYRVYVIGKVNNPGQFTVGRYVDVIQALTLAGGLTPYAREGDIKIIRRNGSGESVFPFQYSAVKNGELLDQNIMLYSGDVVVVP